MTQRTFFGLEVVSGNGVRTTDIACLPFAAFWCESVVRSAQTRSTAAGGWLVRLHDWEAFSKLFIATGRHRNMPRPPEVLWFDRDDDEPEHTYFGLEVLDHQYVRRIDIAHLPFYEFWLEANGDDDEAVISMLVDLEDWRSFTKRFIETGRGFQDTGSKGAL